MSEISSKSVDKPTQCPQCGKVFDYTMYPEIIIPGDNKLKKRVLNKTLFFPKCPYCGEEFKIRANCMYRNETRREWFVVTDTTDKEIESMMRTGDIRLSDIKTEDNIVEFAKGLYKRRVVHDVDAFREKILLSDYNYDDRIIELMKLSRSRIIEKQNHVFVYRIFLEEAAGSQFDITAITGRRPPFEYITIKAAQKVYADFRNKYLDRLGNPEDDEYISTDQKWAEESGLLGEENTGLIVPMQF